MKSHLAEAAAKLAGTRVVVLADLVLDEFLYGEIARVSRDLRLEVDLFVRGGLAVLAAIRRQDYDVWSRRPTVGKLQKLSLLGRACWTRWSSRS